MLQSRLPSFLVPPSRRWSRSLGRWRRAQRPSKPSFQEGPGLSPNNAGVLAHLRLGIRDGHRRLVSRLVPLPRLRVGLEGGGGQREVGKTWGRWSRRGVLNALVRTRVRLEHLLPSLGGPVICPHLPLSNSPAATVNSTWPRLGGNLETCAWKTLQSLCWTYDVLVKFYVS